MVAEIGGLMGPLGLPGAIAGVVSKLGRKVIDPAMIQQLDDLLGQTLMAGRRTFRLSSFNPEKGIARLHDIESGERLAHKLDELVGRLKSAEIVPGIPAPLGEGVTRKATSSGERFLAYPATQAAPTQAGQRIEAVGSIGPKGGVKLTKRKIPTSATR